MLAHRLRRWSNIIAILAQRFGSLGCNRQHTTTQQSIMVLISRCRPKQTRDVETKLIYCGSTGPAVNQHWFNIACTTAFTNTLSASKNPLTAELFTLNFPLFEAGIDDAILRINSVKCSAKPQLQNHKCSASPDLGRRRA